MGGGHRGVPAGGFLSSEQSQAGVGDRHSLSPPLRSGGFKRLEDLFPRWRLRGARGSAVTSRGLLSWFQTRRGAGARGPVLGNRLPFLAGPHHLFTCCVSASPSPRFISSCFASTFKKRYFFRYRYVSTSQSEDSLPLLVSLCLKRQHTHTMASTQTSRSSRPKQSRSHPLSAAQPSPIHAPDSPSLRQ